MRLLLPLLVLFPLVALPQGHEPKNLKILKPDQIKPVMQHFRVALGVECTFCHVQGDFASDEKEHKLVARKMMEMTHEINAKFPDGNMHHVSCYTCHRGAEHPATQPPGEGEGEKH
jgi:hypothetical protein